MKREGINKTALNNIWAIADTHFGHKNIIAYEDRPFDSLSHMDKTIINNINSKVLKDDLVYFLGDYSFYNKEKTKNITQQIRGRKVLIMGNHDVHSKQWYLDCGFDHVSVYPIVLKDFYILSHEPMYMNRHAPYTNIYGHVHSDEKYKNCTSNTFCACVERIKYTPISLLDIAYKMNNYYTNRLEEDLWI